MSDVRYYARSASDKTDDWAAWFVADRQMGGLNVTADIVRKYINSAHSGGVFCKRDLCKKLAEIASAASQ